MCIYNREGRHYVVPSFGKEGACTQLNPRTGFTVRRTTYGMFDEEGRLKNPPTPKTTTEEEESQEADDAWF